NVQTASGATDAVKVIDQAIDDVTNLRGTLGAFQQNTLAATANNLRATLENTVAAESTIRDADYAQEIANFTKQQILLQTGISVLANANQVPQLVLSLLQR
ncbi:MAG: flagellin, partial [Gemmatales bacterium]|nr:flagellin [Gemmatales bacterium]